MLKSQFTYWVKLTLHDKSQLKSCNLLLVNQRVWEAWWQWKHFTLPCANHICGACQEVSGWKFDCKAGCTLEDFKPDLHPQTIGGCGQIRGLSQAIFLSKKSSIVWFHYDYLTAHDRDGASPNSNRKYQTSLIFTTLDRAASDVIPAITNESEQASLTGCCVLL